MTRTTESTTYFPPPESAGGWRCLATPDSVRSIGGMDYERLKLASENQQFLYGSDSWSIVIIRNGYMVAEFWTANVMTQTRFDVWSITKTFTSAAWGCLIDDSRHGRIPGGRTVDLDSRAYQYLPEGFPLSDPRKEHITIHHLLSMTSGIPGAAHGVMGIPDSTEHGAFEHALGRCANRYGMSVAELLGEPGTVWDYSDPAFAHLSLVFHSLAGREISDYFAERIAAPIGIEELSWDIQGSASSIGFHTNAHSGVHISAREIARLGYLFLHGGKWQGSQIIPEWWVTLSTSPSQDLNPTYGYAWILNTGGKSWPNLPADTYAMNSGYKSNRCYIVPSLDLVVARVGSGPSAWEEEVLMRAVVEAVVE